LKALFGDAATKENDFAFHYMPKVDRKLLVDADLGQHVSRFSKGMLAFGMNGVAIGPDSRRTSMP